MTNQPTVNPSEVGWQFVPQYYTFVNKQPNRLHCFYTKASTFIHGTEGEDGKPCYGQAEIHAKITSIGFQDCKVFIHSVDAQSSANGGIIIQVIGEMSNKGEPWKKFVQTFFLAEQPNGYFVLNDIFRFLKEETVEDEPADETEPVADAPAVQEPPAAPATPAPAPPPPAAEPEPAPEPAREPTPPPAPAPEPEEPEVPAAPESVAEQQPNGEASEEAEPSTQSAAPSSQEASAVAPSPVPTPSPAPAASPAPPAPEPAAPSPAPQAAPVVAAPAPTQPTPATPVRKTWANLAATGSNKWGSAVAQEAKGVSEAPVSTSSPAPSTPHSPAPRNQSRPHPLFVQASTAPTPECFVKGVVETVTDAALKNTLTQRFGPIKEMEIVRNKACAFLEFTNLDAARRCLIASLPRNAGGEGGIRIGDPNDNSAPVIHVEIRKERGDRPPPRGPPVNGGDRGRGGFRGRGAPRGRGIPQQK